MIRLGQDAIILQADEIESLCCALKMLSLEDRKRLERDDLQTMCDLHAVDKRIRFGDPCPCCGVGP